MRFIRTEGWDEAIAAVAKRLVDELATGKSVLWLVSGGSQIPANAEIMRAIPSKLSHSLSIMPVDERYGPAGHADSNWTKLMAAGFEPKQARLIPVLQDGLDFAVTADRYDQLAARALASHDVIIGQLGMGIDGHTAGILPDSPACAVTDKMVAHYEAAPFKRLTLTFAALRKINIAYLLAYGSDKKEPLENLKQDLPLERQPAQIIKDIAEAYVYNDQLGETNG